MILLSSDKHWEFSHELSGKTLHVTHRLDNGVLEAAIVAGGVSEGPIKVGGAAPRRRGGVRFISWFCEWVSENFFQFQNHPSIKKWSGKKFN